MRRILMTHLYFGDPSEEFSLQLAKTLLDAGADILEVGIPYTDPVCDGEIFQRVCKRALGNGITPFKVFDGIRKIRDKGYKQKIYLTSYYGPIFRIGVNRVVDLAKEGGVDGLIVPDLLLEEQGELKRACGRLGISLIQFATVYSNQARLTKIVKYSDEFIYCISLPGVTGDYSTPSRSPDEHLEGGQRDSSQVILRELIRKLRSITDRKILVGFGIKSAKEVKNILQMGADGVIVGSAIARMYEKNIKNPEKSLSEIAAFIKHLNKLQ